MAEENAALDILLIDHEGREGGEGRSRLFEFDEGTQTLLVEEPTKAGRRLPTEQGGRVRVRAVFGRMIYAFEATVVGHEVASTARGPIAMVRIEAPEQLKSGNRRRHFRAAPLVSAPVTLSWRLAPPDPSSENRRDWNKARVVDVSGGGAGVWIVSAHAAEVEVGRTIEVSLQFRTPSGVKSIRRLAVVRRMRGSPEGARGVFLGVEFVLDASQREDCVEELVEYVTWRQRESARLERERDG
jgi:c-di-GMP-binding flagellar brake protein YcgR